MAVTTQDIVDLNKRVDEAKELYIRYQARKENLTQSRDTLIKEIKDAGYNPSTLKSEYLKLQDNLETDTLTLSKKLEKSQNLHEKNTQHKLPNRNFSCPSPIN